LRLFCGGVLEKTNKPSGVCVGKAIGACLSLLPFLEPYERELWTGGRAGLHRQFVFCFLPNNQHPQKIAQDSRDAHSTHIFSPRFFYIFNDTIKQKQRDKTASERSPKTEYFPPCPFGCDQEKSRKRR
jgi:hypothetical protein